ncbi:hypothetical protein [Profundibacterium mesophilum]|uniref:Major vault protein n=1 Tax=Profundibacterium mesophilum KAUST100406-0324 TaxID=1037889 RepID=A0A921NWZ2_9RHOB|nr:hypothetical protein [Profundibacterium mesophilum]KAF0675068.1 major vault protein [Profundibacterium mesophilum KAUST100406-0324]
MTDLATLGFDVQTASLVKGERALDNLAKTGETTERRLGTATDGIRKGAQRAGDGLDSMASEARRASQPISVLGSESQSAARRVEGLGDVSARSGAQLQNASYQVGDFFTQIAGGQSAVLALSQQLPQLLVGFGALGAGLGAVAAIGGAFYLMAGRSGDAVGDFSESLSDLSTQLDAYRDLAENVQLPTDQLAEKFGAGAEAVRKFYAEIERINRGDLLDSASKLIGSVVSNSGGYDGYAQVQDQFPLRSSQYDERKLAQKQIGLEQDALAAQGIAAQIEATERLYQNTLALAELRGDRSEEEEAYIRQLAEVIIRLNEIRTATDGGAQAEAARAEAIARSAQAYGQSRAQAAEAQAAAQDELASLRAQADMQALIAEFGRDSVEVTTARVQAERDAYAEALASRDVSQELKDQLLAAWDAASGVASVDMAGGITLAANEAARLAQNMAAVISAAGAAAAPMGPDQARLGVMDATSPMATAPGRVEDGLYGVVMRRTYRADPKPAGASRSRRSGGSSGGGRGGGVSEEVRAAQREQTEGMREAERWIDRTRTATEQYNDELRELADLNEAGYFAAAPEAYSRAVRMVGDELERAQFGEFQRGIESISEAIGRNITSLEDMGDAVASVLQRMADDIITSGINEAISGLFSKGSGGIGGFFSNLLSFDGGGYTGNGPRAGGLDGKGGFLAMMHPQEDVIDRTANRAGPGGASGSIRVEVALNDGMLNARIDNRATNVGASISSATATSQARAFGGQATSFQNRGTS